MPTHGRHATLTGKPKHKDVDKPGELVKLHFGFYFLW